MDSANLKLPSQAQSWLKAPFRWVSILFLISVFWWFLSPIGNGDVFMYFSLGQKLLSHGTLPGLDPFVSESIQLPFHWQHEWLSYVVFASLESVGGLSAVVVLKASLILVVLVGLLVFSMRVRTLSWLTLLFLLIAVMAIAPRWGERAYLFSDLFTAFVAVCLLLLDRTRNFKWVLALPFLFFLWVELHPGYPLGFVLCGFYLVTRIHRRRDRDWQILAGAVVTSLTLPLFNPLGVEGFLYPFEKFFAANWDIYRQINSEWMPTGTSDSLPLASKVFLLGLGAMVLAAAVLSAFRKDYFPLITLLLIALAVQSVRFVTTATWVSLPFLFSSPVMNEMQRFLERTALRQFFLVVGTSTCIFLFSFSVFEIPRQGWFWLQKEVWPASAPRQALEELQKLPPGTVFAEWDWNSVIVWKSGARHRVVAHGHVDDPVYAVQNFLAITRSSEDFARIVRAHGVRYFLLSPETVRSPSSVLAQELRKAPWKVKHRDASAILFVRD